jgi:hypothetical protein
MKFQEMDPEVVRALLDQKDERGNPLYPDMLTPEVAKEESFFRTAVCPACRKGSVEPFVDARTPFVSNSPLVRRRMRCLSCKTEFDPYTGLVLRATAIPG